MDAISIGIILVVFVLVFWYMNRSQKKRQQQTLERVASMEPGTWVMTSTGFYGRFIDMDGDVAILETADGTETYWLRQALRGPAEPPFASDDSSDASDATDTTSDTLQSHDDDENKDTKDIVTSEDSSEDSALITHANHVDAQSPSSQPVVEEDTHQGDPEDQQVQQAQKNGELS